MTDETDNAGPEQNASERIDELVKANQRLQQEIADLRQVEKTLRLRVEQYKRITENAKDMIYRMSIPDGKYEYMSAAAAEMTGYSPDEWYADSQLIKKVIHPESHHYFETQWGELVQGQVPPSYEFQIVRKSGEVRWINQRNVLIRNEQGAPVAIEGIATDITDRKRMEQALEQRLLALTRPLESTADIKFEDLFNLDEIQKIQDAFADATGVASIITTADGQPITRQSNFCHLCQNIIRQTEKGLANCYHSDAIIGRMNLNGPVIQPCLSGGLWDGGASIRAGDRHIANWLIGQVLDDTDHPERMMAYAKEIGANEEEYREALKRVPRMPKEQFTKVCGALFLIAEQLSRLALQNVQQARYITERKAMEGEIQQLNRSLEQRVADRTAQLEAANKELEAFAYSVSHDLRAPLRHIDGFLELLQKRIGTVEDLESRHYMDTISGSAKRMGVLIDDLLNFSRIGRSEMFRTSVDMQALVRDVIEEISPDTSGRIITWHIGDLPTIRGDHAMLRAVLANLITNAVKFTRPRAQTEIDITCRSTPEAHVFSIRDNGVGFDPAHSAKLFNVFQRLHRADEFEGTGIGLANVRRIIDRHGGRTWAEGTVNNGATIFFSLPTFTQGDT
ncbi:MAG TPA: PocR ligand-binding domain-containing protein [Bacteroidota bacterium]|nr:PocR ligand-binding domain-containing protein [Bacteroidota bacterium]